MSKNDGRASGKGQGAASVDSVYDFLFYDARRVGSFLAQLSDHGPLQLLKTSEGVTEASTEGVNFAAELGLPGVGKLSAGTTSAPTKSGSESSERTYDPYWINALRLLDFLQDAQLLHRRLEQSALGHIVLIGGSMQVIDLSLFKGVWDMGYLRDMLSAATGLDTTPFRGHRKHQAPSRHQGNSQADVIFDLIKSMPHVVQARLTTPGHANVWCSLPSDGLVMDPAALLLKYGVQLSGTWHILGILDALPIVAPETEISDSADPQMMLGDLFSTFANPARQLLGRPDGAFGVTPLLIFREIKSQG
jgi:hypothetical protein